LRQRQRCDNAGSGRESLRSLEHCQVTEFFLKL
jgi:hypothetical protein